MCDRGISSMLDVPGLCRYRRRRADSARKLPYLSRASGAGPGRGAPGHPGPARAPSPRLSGAGVPLGTGAWGAIRGRAKRPAPGCRSRAGVCVQGAAFPVALLVFWHLADGETSPLLRPATETKAPAEQHLHWV